MFLRVSWNAYIAAVMLTQRVTCEVGKWPLSRFHDGLIIIKKVNEENTVSFSGTGICKEDGARLKCSALHRTQGDSENSPCGYLII